MELNWEYIERTYAVMSVTSHQREREGGGGCSKGRNFHY